jgi:hypothetical protein
MPLQPIYEVYPFTQWGLDFIGMIYPHSFVGHMFILVATDYCTRWSKVIDCRKSKTDVVIKFLEDHIITRFGM